MYQLVVVCFILVWFSSSPQGFHATPEDLLSAVNSDPYSPASFMSRKTLQSGSSYDHVASVAEEAGTEPGSLTDDTVSSDPDTAPATGVTPTPDTGAHEEPVPLPEKQAVTTQPTPMEDPVVDQSAKDLRVEEHHVGEEPHQGKPLEEPRQKQPWEEEQQASDAKDMLEPYLQWVSPQLWDDSTCHHGGHYCHY